MTSVTPNTFASPPDDGDQNGAQTTGADINAEADEARIVAAWKSGKYRSKERCLKALGLERLHNAALWKRVKRAIDRDGRRAANAITD